jgi:uncharacterized protein
VNACASNPLCLECGLCCNGVIFVDVRLQPAEDDHRLQSLGLLQAAKNTSLASAGSRNPTRRFLQPCAALEGCRCRIYAERPRHCHEFDCLLLKRFQRGEIERNAALRIIRGTRRRSEAVKRLLRQLGDAREQTALSLRFRRVKQRMESGAPSRKDAEVFSRLTLAYHELTLLLGQSFYRPAK